MVMWDRIVPTCFLDSDLGFQDVLFVLCLHANQYTYSEKNCVCLPQPKFISKHHVTVFNFSFSTSVKWQLFDLWWVSAEWNFLENCKWCLVLCTWHFGEGESMHFSLQKVQCLCQLLLAFISQYKLDLKLYLFFYLQLHKSCLKLMYVTGVF